MWPKMLGLCFPALKLSMTLVNEGCQGTDKQNSLIFGFVLWLVCCSDFLLLFWFLQACMSDEHSQRRVVPPCDIVLVPGPNEVGAGGGSAATKEPSVQPLSHRGIPHCEELSAGHMAEVQTLWMVPVTHKNWNTLGNLAQVDQGLWFNGLNWARGWVLALAACLIQNHNFQQKYSFNNTALLFFFPLPFKQKSILYKS